jgi:nitric oxide reductase large subunit
MTPGGVWATVLAYQRAPPQPERFATSGGTTLMTSDDIVAGKGGFGLWAFWLYNGGLLLWILLNFFPIGWLQLNAVFEHGFAYAPSQEFYDTTLIWQWMRLPGDVLFAVAALLMARDFPIKLRPLYPRLAGGLPGPHIEPPHPEPGE